MNNSKYIFSAPIRNFFWTKTKLDFGKYQIVTPGKVSETLKVPDHIPKPNYYETGIPDTIHMFKTPEVKNLQQISRMRNSCKLAANILNEVEKIIKVGIETDQIDKFVFNSCIKNGAYPSPLNYKMFPKSVCTSVNNVACHGIPDNRTLEDGDIVNVDITVFYDGYHGDCSKTFAVGNVDEQGKNLIAATADCLNKAISICRPGVYFQDIGYCIEDHAEYLGYKIIPAFIGHGIGSYFHGPPDIYHIRNTYPGKMAAGMTFTIEPILTQGDDVTIEILEDDWTAVTVDDARTAQFEHTILITESGVEILTK